MKNKILRSMKQRVLTVLFISTVILFVVIFGMTTVQCVKAFSYDSLRIAETKTRESVEIFNENAEEYVLKTQFIAAQLQGKAYETEEDYADLMKLLASDAESNGFLSLSVFDKRGEHHTMATPYYGDSSEVNSLLAQTTGTSVTSVYRSEAAGKFCVAIYAP